MIVVSDTSALTALIQVGRASLLSKIYEEVWIPKSVRSELIAFHGGVPGFLQCGQPESQIEVSRLAALLDLGEAEAIVLAKEIKADELLIDEARGRRVAADEGLRVIGLLGVLLIAKRKGFINSVREVTEELQTKAKFRVSDAVKAIIFEEAGEI